MIERGILLALSRAIEGTPQSEKAKKLKELYDSLVKDGLEYPALDIGLSFVKEISSKLDDKGYKRLLLFGRSLSQMLQAGAQITVEKDFPAKLMEDRSLGTEIAFNPVDISRVTDFNFTGWGDYRQIVDFKGNIRSASTSECVEIFNEMQLQGINIFVQHNNRGKYRSIQTAFGNHKIYLSYDEEANGINIESPKGVRTRMGFMYKHFEASSLEIITP